MGQKLSLFLIIILYFGISHAQQNANKDTIFYDENAKLITLDIFEKKIKSKFLRPVTYSVDNQQHYRVVDKYIFGDLTKTETSQLWMHIGMSSKRTITSEESIIIKFVDSLTSFNEEMTKHIAHTWSEAQIDSLNKEDGHRHLNHKFNKRIFDRNARRWERKLSKCKRRFERKFDCQVVYMNTIRDETSPKFEKVNWIKSTKLLKAMFFKKDHDFDYVLLKPNGQYFLVGGHLSDKSLYTLIKEDNWEQFEQDLKHSKSTFKGIGLFAEDYRFHKTHCF